MATGGDVQRTVSMIGFFSTFPVVLTATSTCTLRVDGFGSEQPYCCRRRLLSLRKKSTARLCFRIGSQFHNVCCSHPMQAGLDANSFATSAGCVHKSDQLISTK